MSSYLDWNEHDGLSSGHAQEMQQSIRDAHAKLARQISKTYGIPFRKAQEVVSATTVLSAPPIITSPSSTPPVSVAPQDAATGATQPFQLVKIDEHTIRVMASTLIGKLPAGFSEGDTPHYNLSISGTTGYIYACVTFTTPHDATAKTSGTTAGSTGSTGTTGTTGTAGSTGETVAPDTTPIDTTPIDTGGVDTTPIDTGSDSAGDFSAGGGMSGGGGADGSW